jgi:hypothetical protein
VGPSAGGLAAPVTPRVPCPAVPDDAGKNRDEDEVKDTAAAAETVEERAVGRSDVADGAGRDDVADEDVVDELPEDLDAAGYVGPYVFPNNNRRRIPAALYLGIALLCVVAWMVVDSPYVNRGFLFAGVLLGAFGVYQLVVGWNLDVDDQDALTISAREVGFPIGHASAQLGWRGLLSRPTWRILLYSAEDPPEQRGLVLVDGVDGRVVEHFVEPNPEDWSEYSGS